MMRTTLAGAAFAAACSGCGVPDETITVSAREDAWTMLGPTSIQARVGLLDGGDLELVRGEDVLARASIAAGKAIPLEIDGQSCVATIVGLYEVTDTDYRPDTKKPTTRDLRTRTARGLNLQLRCAGGPVPGTTGTLRGANPRRSFPLAVAGVVPGIALGAAAAREHFGVVVLLLLATIAAAVTLGVVAFDDAFRITLPIVFAGYAVIGAYASLAAHEDRDPGLRVLIVGVGVLAPVPVVLAYPAWDIGGPLVALAATAVALLIALLVRVFVRDARAGRKRRAG